MFTRAKVFTCDVPFGNKSAQTVISAIVRGDRPSRPTHPGLTDKLWVLTQHCWDQDANQRPNALRISCSLYVLTLELSLCRLTGSSGVTTLQRGNA